MNIKKWMKLVKHAGKTSSDTPLWHFEPDIGKYWCGNWEEKTPMELYLTCQDIIRDLKTNHPEIFFVDEI